MTDTVQRASPVSPPRPRTAAALWFGVLAGPVALLLNEQIQYVITFWGCGEFGAVASVLLHLVPLVLLLITVAAGTVAWRHRTMPLRSPQDVTAEDHNRRGFTALLGMGLSALSGLALIAQWLPVLFFDPCFRT